MPRLAESVVRLVLAIVVTIDNAHFSELILGLVV